jgi:Transposase protein
VEDRIRKPARPAPKDRCGLPAPPPEKRRRQATVATNVVLTPEELPSSVDNDYGQPNATKTKPDVASVLALRCLAHEMVDKQFNVEFHNEYLAISSSKQHVLLEKSCVINQNLEIQIFVFGKPIIDNNKFWKKYPKIWSQELDSQSFFKDLFENWKICKSSTEEKFISKVKESASQADSYGYDHFTNSVRSVDCTLLTEEVVCFHCRKMVTLLRTKYRKRPSVVCRKIVHMTREEAQAKLRRSMLNLANLKNKNKRLSVKMQKLIKSGTSLSKSDNNDFLSILVSDGNKTESSDLAKIFFSEQIKAAKARAPNGHRWHPLMIKWCLYLKSKSASTYSALRKVITLPSERRLYDLQTLSHVNPGFHEDVLDTIVKEVDAAGSEEHRRYCSLLLDEVKIQEDLVYKGSTGELIGFVELSKVDDLINQIEAEAKGTSKTDQPLATHVLQLMVRGITSPVEATYAYFPTKTLKASTLFPIVWEAIDRLEERDVRILAVVSDGAAANRSFYKLCNKNAKGTQWYTENIFAKDEERPLYFVCDVPHLLKTARNAFANSGSHKKSRLLWKNGKQIEWYHAIKTFQADLNPSFRTLTRITHDHLYLTPTSLMRVKLAAQVLSKSMATAMAKLVGKEASETVNFIKIFDKFFDVLNTRHLREGIFKRNPDLNPFTSPDDPRLHWLNDEFLGYLEEWKSEVKERPGNFTTQHRSKMLLSRETQEGLFITGT